ncbi:ABC transporter permease [Nonomuraea endophytica]|uniref:ABC-2 type transport system permease protein n=1 Tax=Nonomuraea endophytica TaxID=714136 RepID=A0A7W8A4K9_9ACTN|nr:ABC-2 family transporter protein [Nonomuraea endophytica]MBB5078740.1 ABC-2 type transport system permease protein [Nonomuraea endophytica]
MTILAVPSGWRTGAITAVTEWHSPSRMTAAGLRLAVHLFLVVCLWHALYAGTTVSAGLTEAQAVTYAVLAVLIVRPRANDRYSARDTVIQHINFGTIVYWFLRPLPARRYYFFRAAGDQVYGLAWALAGYLVCLAAGVLDPPPSAGAALAFAATFALGQAVTYYLLLLTDQLCFWTIKNSSAVDIMMFTQNLLSGAYAALWFFPGWFQALSAALPFQATINVPLSFYVGRLPLSELPGQLALQGFWVLLLAALTRFLWTRAAGRVVAQGG